ncbi:cupredoxin domain-containing protein [Limimaricola pyoseonensis]|uniref:Plastocyanin n=1 Tax=Limimaricola pyoseonensis TaxID=521013 RepID=A0A1G7GZE4_9RHOB|nr:cupredoxin family copper-binding protein [Limimaricola pyoseonensis]SDE93528.1 Plastocyanin [Limimaricola pyoseonensis]
MPTRRSVLSSSLAALGALPVLVVSARAEGMVHEVTIQGFAFVPARISLAPGDSVVFTNRDLAPHTVTAESGAFDSGRLGMGQSVRMTFPAAGSYPYFCAIHPRMRGAIQVR